MDVLAKQEENNNNNNNNNNEVLNEGGFAEAVCFPAIAKFSLVVSLLLPTIAGFVTTP